MMDERWQEDQAFANKFIADCQQLLGLACIQVADMDEDRHHNTDLMFEVGYKRFPVRIRRGQQRLAFNRRNEVTFRYSRPSGVETELSKLLNGWGDCCLYGWGDEAQGRVVAYTLLDLHKMRGWLCQHALANHALPGRIQHDRDGSSSFIAFCLDCMPADIILKRRTLLTNDPPNTDLHWQSIHAPVLWQSTSGSL